MNLLEFRHQSLIKEVAKFENVETAATMRRMGLNYKVSYGLAIQQIDKIAGIIDKDDEFAQYLWLQDEREAKLVSLRIFDKKSLQISDIKDFIDGIDNLELAEQSAMHLFSKQDTAVELALEMIKHDAYIQLAGYWTIARFCMLNKTANPDIFTKLLKEILKHKPKDEAVYFKRGFAQAILRIGLINEDFAKKVKEAITQISTENKELADYLKQEVFL